MKKSLTYLWFISTVAAFGGLLFGYDAVVVSGTNTQVAEQFNFTPKQLGFYVSCVLWGCMLGSGIAGWLADQLGRKKTLMAAATMIFFSALWSGFSGSVPELIAARLLGGIGIGTATMVCPLYISEVSPEKYRGRMVTLFQLTINIGIVMCVFSNWGIFSYAEAHADAVKDSFGGRILTSENWRMMFLAEALPGLLFFVTALFIPESPRWLVKKGRTDQALRVLKRLNSKEKAQQVCKEIEDVLLQSKKLSFKDLFSRKLKKPLVLSIIVCFFAEACGVSVVFYYGPQILENAGLGLGNSLGGFATIAIVNFFATLVALRFVDSSGRRKLLLIGIVGSMFAHILLSIFFFTEQDGWMIVIAINLFVAFFAVAIGPIKFVLISEIFPNRIRGRAIAVSTVVIWATSASVAQIFPIMRDNMHTGYIFLIFAAVLLIYFVLVKRMMPETKGRTIEDLERSWL